MRYNDLRVVGGGGGLKGHPPAFLELMKFSLNIFLYDLDRLSIHISLIFSFITNMLTYIFVAQIPTPVLFRYGFVYKTLRTLNQIMEHVGSTPLHFLIGKIIKQVY